MKNRFVLYIICLFVYSCHSINNKEESAKSLTEASKGSTVNISNENQDSFYLNNTLFLHKGKLYVSNASFISDCGSLKAETKLSKNKSDTIFNESYFLYDMFDLYHICKTELETNVDFAESFAKKLGWSDENLRMYKLKVEKNIDVEILNYGVCKFLVLKKTELANAEQSKFLILLNYKKKEISLWDFDNFFLKGKDLFIDFKMKNLHSIYKVGFCKNADKFYFLPHWRRHAGLAKVLRLRSWHTKATKYPYRRRSIL